MADHDPRAADVLADGVFLGNTCQTVECAQSWANGCLDALAAAGLVVRTADKYERVEWGWSDDCCNRPVLCGDWPDDPDDRPLYVRKENPDD